MKYGLFIFIRFDKKLHVLQKKTFSMDGSH